MGSETDRCEVCVQRDGPEPVTELLSDQNGKCEHLHGTRASRAAAGGTISCLPFSLEREEEHQNVLAHFAGR